MKRLECCAKKEENTSKKDNLRCGEADQSSECEEASHSRRLEQAMQLKKKKSTIRSGGEFSIESSLIYEIALSQTTLRTS